MCNPKVIHIVQVNVCQYGGYDSSLRASAFRRNAATLFKYTCHKPFANQSQKSTVRNPMLKETHHPFMINHVKECTDIRIQHPPYLTCLYSNRQCIQGVVLALALPESIGEPQKVLLLPTMQN